MTTCIRKKILHLTKKLPLDGVLAYFTRTVAFNNPGLKFTVELVELEFKGCDEYRAPHQHFEATITYDEDTLEDNKALDVK